MLSRRDFLRLVAASPVLRIPVIPVQLSPLRISTGVPRLDTLLEGGWRRGRITQLFGLDAVGLLLLPFNSSEVALRNRLKVTWIAVGRQMVDEYAEVVGFKVGGVRVQLVDDLEAALIAVEQAVRMSDLVVVFAPLAELPTAGSIPPCKQVRRVARAVRRTEASVVVVTDGDEEVVQSMQVGRAVRFYSHTRIRLNKHPQSDQFTKRWQTQFRIVKCSSVTSNQRCPFVMGIMMSGPYE